MTRTGIYADSHRHLRRFASPFTPIRIAAFGFQTKSTIIDGWQTSA